MVGGWSGPKNWHCYWAPLPQVLQMAPAPAPAGAASLRRSGRHRSVGDWAGWVASPNPDKPDSPGRSDSPLVWLELVPKTAKRCRLLSWEGLRAHRPHRGANSDRRHSSGRLCDFHTGVIGAAMAPRLHCRRRRCRPHCAPVKPGNNCFRDCRTELRVRAGRRPEPIMLSEGAQQGPIVRCLFGTVCQSALRPPESGSEPQRPDALRVLTKQRSRSRR
jgi:hypothetical protein